MSLVLTGGWWRLSSSLRSITPTRQPEEPPQSRCHHFTACTPIPPLSRELSSEHSASWQPPKLKPQVSPKVYVDKEPLPVLWQGWCLTWAGGLSGPRTGPPLWCAVSASALSLYLCSTLLPGEPASSGDQGYILGTVAALYSQLPPTLMTKALFWVWMHILRSFPPRTVSHPFPPPSSPPQNTITWPSYRLQGAAGDPEPVLGQLEFTSQGPCVPPINEKCRQADSPVILIIPRKGPKKQQGREWANQEHFQSSWAVTTRLLRMRGCFMLYTAWLKCRGRVGHGRLKCEFIVFTLSGKNR